MMKVLQGRALTERKRRRSESRRREKRGAIVGRGERERVDFCDENLARRRDREGEESSLWLISRSNRLRNKRAATYRSLRASYFTPLFTH